MYTILLGILLVGEEAALLIGTRVMNKNTNPWNSQKNSLFLYLDILENGKDPLPGRAFWRPLQIAPRPTGTH